MTIAGLEGVLASLKVCSVEGSNVANWTRRMIGLGKQGVRISEGTQSLRSYLQCLSNCLPFVHRRGRASYASDLLRQTKASSCYAEVA